MPCKADFSIQFTRPAQFCVLTGLLVTGLLSFSPARAAARPGYEPATQQRPSPGSSSSPTITLAEAEDLLNLLPVVKELRAKGMELKWDAQGVPTMNDKDYYFFWIYNVTAQKKSDIGSISVGNYAVNKHTADVRVWDVSPDVSYGNDGVLATSKELQNLEESLRRKHGIDWTQVREYRSAHLAARIIPRALAQSAIRLPVTERLSNTSEVSCWKGSDHLISRLGRSPTITSSAGYRAYAEVKATAFRPQYQETYSGSLCENTVKLFFTKSRETSFRIVFDTSQPKNDCIAIEGKDWCEVKGIQLLDWSKDGGFLLADLILWEYESDALVIRVPIVYDVAKSKFLRPDVYHFLDEYYKTDAFEKKLDPSTNHCEFELRSEGFAPDSKIVLLASRPPDNPTYDQVFCLDKSQRFLLDLGTNNLIRLPSNYKAQRYGTWSSVSAPKP